MPEIIRDGKGRGYLLEIDADNYMRAKCVQIPHLYFHSNHDQDAFSVHFHHEQQAATSEIQGYLEYTGDKQLFIERIIVCTEEGAATGIGMTTFIVELDGSNFSGGESIDPINMNRKSANTLDVTAIHPNDGAAITSTAGAHLYCIRSSGPDTKIMEFADALILGKNDNIVLKVQAATVGTKTRATIFYAEDDPTK